MFTEGTGNKGGIITLLSENVKVIEECNIGNEAHICALRIMENNELLTIIMANIHAPCAHGHEKITFFKDVKENIDKLSNLYDSSQVILLGDFNTAFDSNDRINTVFTRSEILTSKKITDILGPLSLKDCWEKDTCSMTWKHGAKMSKIDRIQGSSDLMGKYKVMTDWTYTDSDHCAVIVKIESPKFKKRNNIVRIDTRFMSNVILREKFLRELVARMSQLKDTNMDPHQSLEFLKMSIRSIAIEIATNYKKEMEKEFLEVKNEISFWQTSFECAKSEIIREMAQSNLDKATDRRDKYLNDRGTYLSERSKSKWYQEGEKGSKYFLNIVKSKSNKNEMVELKTDNGSTTDGEQIKTMVQSFYKSLYERGDNPPTAYDDFLLNMDQISTENKHNILTPLNIQEVFATLKSCLDSAPGPDGIPYSLIKFTWSIYGPVLMNSWAHSISTGVLPPSHRASYLRLIPKEGKDLTQLKNWRPITLSNCDIKIITKTISSRMTSNLTSIIGHNQTAYMKGRQITDNLHIMHYAIAKANELDDDSMIVSLDAEKAFDSISHSYIKKIFEHIGLGQFNTTFDLLYNNQQVDIIVNNELSGSYKIKNGVKQGDALSCILFILGIEPLIRNIEHDPLIKEISYHDVKIPKILSYADDVACVTKPLQNNLDRIFAHYEKMTALSGLKLNADKTELISRGGKSSYNINYGGSTVTVLPSEIIKINGLHLSYDTVKANDLNLSKIYTSMENQFKLWKNMYLSILGKIIVFKTFGLSQILFIASTILIPTNVEKKLIDLIYKFIWNSNIESKKAPDRIKRNIMTTPVSMLGFGMVDYREVIRSIRIKTFMRMISSESHPLNLIIKNSLTNSVINVDLRYKLNPVLDDTIRDINRTWKLRIKECSVDERDILHTLIGNEYVGNLLIKRFRNKRQGLYHRHDKLSEILSSNPSNTILKKLDRNIYQVITLGGSYINLTKYNFIVPTKSKILLTNNITSKQIRTLNNPQTILTPKLLSNVTTDSLNRLGKRIKNLTNTKLKTIILRALHGDIYCGTRLQRFGMTDTDECQRCGAPETTSHLLLDCPYVKKIWEICSKLTSIPTIGINEVLGYHDFHDKTTLTIHCEIIRRLLAIERPVTDQLKLVKSVIDRLAIVERGICKHTIKDLQSHLNKKYPINYGAG